MIFLNVFFQFLYRSPGIQAGEAGSWLMFSECTGAGRVVIACPQTLLCCSDRKQTLVFSVVLNKKYKLYSAPFTDAE